MIKKYIETKRKLHDLIARIESLKKSDNDAWLLVVCIIIIYTFEQVFFSQPQKILAIYTFLPIISECKSWSFRNALLFTKLPSSKM